MESSLTRVLESLGVETSVIERFHAQEITSPEIVLSLSDDQLVTLGIQTLGKRQLLRSLCRKTESGK